jgi:hypothetical protein
VRRSGLRPIATVPGIRGVGGGVAAQRYQRDVNVGGSQFAQEKDDKPCQPPAAFQIPLGPQPVGKKPQNQEADQKPHRQLAAADLTGKQRPHDRQQ